MEIEQLLGAALADVRHGWSVGTVGAIGEFMRDAEEPVVEHRADETRTLYTSRAGIRVRPRADLKVVAYDTLSSDGETWGQSVAFCLPAPANMEPGVVRGLGPDTDAIRPED